MSQEKERPILFSGPMVRAILEGRKTVTRRPIKHQPFDLSWSRRDHRFEYVSGRAENGDEVDGFHAYTTRSGGQWSAKCPYGQPGDRLWVRETWGVISHDFDQQGNAIDWEPDRPAKAIREMRFGRGYYSGHVVYAADGPCEWAGDEDGGGDPRSAWKPSIHMPRTACRILLEITGVRVERLQGISDEQALAEGVRLYADHAELGDWYHVEGIETYSADPRKSFELLWASINGAEAWSTNPWVWVVEFKRIEP